jgi:hypothetical protein
VPTLPFASEQRPRAFWRARSSQHERAFRRLVYRCSLAFAAAQAVLLSACLSDVAGPNADRADVIALRWLKSYPQESRSDVETGLLWSLSLLGAKLPRGAPVIHWEGERITLDLAQAQVLDGTRPAWELLIAAMKASGEYQTLGAIDVGRFLAIALGSANVYYALTGARPEYAAARERYRFEQKSAAIVSSTVAYGSRRIDISIAERAEQIAFVAFEGSGSLADGSFAPREAEVLDMMPNGQLRFALYDLEGRLKGGATAELTRAGKPAKCMWCHESRLLSTFVDYPAVAGFYDRRELDALVAGRGEMLRQYRERLDTQIEYGNREDHTFGELLYLTFEEPSLERLAREWGVSVGRATELVRGKPTHAHAEFPHLGSELYRREDVDGLAPYAVIAAPPSVRELSPHERDVLGIRP